MMKSSAIHEHFDRQIYAAEQHFEAAKAAMFEGKLEPKQFLERREIARELEFALGELHETRRHIALLEEALFMDICVTEDDARLSA